MRQKKTHRLRLAVSALALCPSIVLAQTNLPATRPAEPSALSAPDFRVPAFPRAKPATRPAGAAAPATHPSAATVQSPDTQPAESQPADTQPATTQADTNPAAEIQLNFKDAPLDAVLQYLSEVAGFVIVKDAPVDGRVTLLSMQPVTAEQAVMLLNTVLHANGLTALTNGRTIRIVQREQAKKSDIPVHFGSDPNEIEATDELITQVIPIKNVDAVKLHQDLKPLIGTQADVTSNAGSNAIVITDTSANIRRIAEIISTLDKNEGSASEMRIIPLKNANAGAAVKLILSVFHSEEPLPKDPNQAKLMLEMRREGKQLGGGVDQALHGGKVTAAADERTNSVIVAGPTETIKLIENMLRDLDGNESAVSAIRSFHLKVANAESTAELINSMFHGDLNGVPHPGEQGARAHVTATVEYRTNTVVVSAPTGAMTIIEGIIKDLETNPGISPNIHTYHLKYADAASLAKEVDSVFQDDRYRRRGTGASERVAITSDTRTNTIIVTGAAESLSVVDRLIKDLDTSPTAGNDVKFFHLKQADAVNAAKSILSFFKPPDSQQRRSDQDTKFQSINATADDRTNTVMVTAPTEAMKTVEQIVQELEAEPTTRFEFRSYALQYADAETTAKQLTTMFTPDPNAAKTASAGRTPPRDALHGQVIATADDRTNTVLVTAPAETIEVIDGMVKLLDANPAAAEDLQVFQLQYADASSAAKLIESVFEPDSTTSGRPRSGSSSDPNHHTVAVHASADDRTNTLVVTAPGDVLKIVQHLVTQLDSNPASQDTFFIYRLRNAQSQNLSLVLNEMFGNFQTGGTGSGINSMRTSGSSSSSQRLSPGFGGRQSSAFGRSGLNSAGSGMFASNNRTSRTGSTNGYPGMMGQLPPGMMGAMNELTGQVYVVADPDTNSLLVTTATKYQKQVRQIIEELDRPVRQVLIKVLVAEVTHNDAADWGVDFSILNQRASGKGVTVGQSLGNGAAYAANGGLAVSLLESNVQATLHALAIQGKLDVLSRPYILASDNQEASISVGQQVPIVTDVRVTDTGQLIATPTYQQVGIILNVTPHINPEGLVILDVAPEISQLTNSNVQIAPGVQSPIFNQRTAQSRVGIKNGQTIVIGGLMEDRKNVTVNKVPILGDIPLIGELFKRTQTDKTKTELLIFLTPHVAQQPDSLLPMSKDEMNGTRLTPNAVEPGTFQEHMKGMQRGNIPDTQPSLQSTIDFNDQAPTTQPGAVSDPIHMPSRH